MAARLARVFLAVALLAAWQAALLHPLEHVDDRGALVHIGDGKSRDSGNHSGKLCDALAALTACAPGAQHTLAAFDSADSPSRIIHRAPRQAEAPPFLSQGPPALL